MKALTYSRYGDPEQVLRLRTDADKPDSPGPNEVLVKCRATAINDFDWSLVTGRPAAYRLMLSLLRPKNPTPGIELSGTVEAVGGDVTRFKPGDGVYGDLSNHRWGAFAEYACVHESAVRHKPRGMSFEQAAAIPHASMLAYQGLVDVGKITRGDARILINGAGGGMGTHALYVARQLASPSAVITGVDSGEKLELMRELGYDQVINYETDDFTRNGHRYDLILDAKTTRPPWKYTSSLNPGGRYVTVGGHLTRLVQLLLLGGIIRRRTRKSLSVLGLKTNDYKGMDVVEKWFEEGKLQARIDGPHTFEEIPKLINYFGKGEHKGKIVVSLVHKREDS